LRFAKQRAKLILFAAASFILQGFLPHRTLPVPFVARGRQSVSADTQAVD
jgi:hypothetical protein